MKTAAFSAMISSNVEPHVARRLLEQCENYRYLFTHNDDDAAAALENHHVLLGLLENKFHENSEISGYFLDPSEETAKAFLNLLISSLFADTYLKQLASFLQKALKIPPTKRFFDSLRDMLRKCLPSLAADPLKQAELQFKLLIVQGKLRQFPQHLFANLLTDLDGEIERIKATVEQVLNTAQLPNNVGEQEVLAAVGVLKEVLPLALYLDSEIYNVADLYAAARLSHLNPAALPIIGYILNTHFEATPILSSLPEREIMLHLISIIFRA